MSLRLLNHGHKAVMTFGSCSLPGKKLWQDVTEASMPSAQPQSGPGEHSLHTMYKSRNGRNFMTDRLVDYSFSFFSPSSRPCHPRKAKACPSSVLKEYPLWQKRKEIKALTHSRRASVLHAYYYLPHSIQKLALVRPRVRSIHCHTTVESVSPLKTRTLTIFTIPANMTLGGFDWPISSWSLRQSLEQLLQLIFHSNWVCWLANSGRSIRSQVFRDVCLDGNTIEHWVATAISESQYLGCSMGVSICPHGKKISVR